MPYHNSRPRNPEICPICGASVEPRALACPECGADHRTGWNEQATREDGLGLPEDGFDYDDFVEKEFGRGPGRAAIHPVWWVTAVLLLSALLVMWFFASE